MRAHLAAGLIVTAAVLWFLAFAAVDKLSIKLSKYAVFPGGDFVLTCHVPRDERNRLLEYGIVNFRERSERDLEGIRAPITTQVDIKYVPCGAGPAYCIVYRNDRSSESVTANFLVIGCE